MPSGRERVHRRVDHRGRHRDAAGLAEALGAERVAGRRGVHLLDQQRGHVGRARDRVVHERARQALAVGIVDDGLHQGLAQALGQRAVELPFRQERVDDGARVVHPDERLEVEHPRLRLDREPADHRAGAPDLAVRLEVGGRLEPRRVARRQGLAARVGRGGHLLPRHALARHARHLEAAAHRHDVLAARPRAAGPRCAGPCRAPRPRCARARRRPGPRCGCRRCRSPRGRSACRRAAP